MPPSKKPAPQSKFFKGSDVLEKALPAVKARAVDEKDVRDAAASPSQPVLDYAALVPFRLPRLKTYDSLYSVLFMLLSVAAMFGVHGRVSCLRVACR